MLFILPQVQINNFRLAQFLFLLRNRFLRMTKSAIRIPDLHSQLVAYDTAAYSSRPISIEFSHDCPVKPSQDINHDNSRLDKTKPRDLFHRDLRFLPKPVTLDDIRTHVSPVETVLRLNPYFLYHGAGRRPGVTVCRGDAQ